MSAPFVACDVHSLHEAIHDTALSQAEIEEWQIQPDHLRSPYREILREARWEFGRTLVPRQCHALSLVPT